MTLLNTTLTLPICALLLITSLNTFADPPPKAGELDVEIKIGHTMIDFKKNGNAGKKSNYNSGLRKKTNKLKQSSHHNIKPTRLDIFPDGRVLY